MALVQLPIEVGILAFSFKVDLDNRPFEFRFTYNQRLELWTMNISDDAGTALLVGQPVRVKQDLLRLFKHNTALPQGELFAFNLVDENEDPLLDNFGDDVIILYNEVAA